MHWGALWTDEGEANLFTHPESCPISLQPELKACAVSLTLAKLENRTQSDRTQAAQAISPSPTEKSLSIKS
jgi:ferredoxin-nitrate reductase